MFSSRCVVPFVHGCFWHGHDCKRGNRLPQTNADYWTKKLAGNAARDARNRVELEALGWRVLVVWECEVKGVEALADRLQVFLGGTRTEVG